MEAVEIVAKKGKDTDVFSQFASDPRHKQEMQAQIQAKVQAHITNIQVILQGRMRENQRAQFDESLNFIAHNMPHNDTVARQLTAWREGFLQVKGRDVTLPHIVRRDRPDFGHAYERGPSKQRRIGRSATSRP